MSTAAFDGHPMEVAFDVLASLGVSRVEPAFIRGYTEFDEDSFAQAFAQKLRSSLKGRGLVAQAISAHMDLSLDEAGPMLSRRIAFAREVGSPILITNAGPFGARPAVMRLLERTIPVLEDAGIVLALENPGHGSGDLIGQGEDGAALMRSLDSPQVRLNVDVGNLLTYAGAVEPGLAAALPFAAHMHWKDVAEEGPDWCFVPLGDGLIDWAHVAQARTQLCPGTPVGIELPLRLQRPRRLDPLRASEPLPLDMIRTAVARSLATWTSVASD